MAIGKDFETAARRKPAPLASEVEAMLARAPARAPIWQVGAAAARADQRRIAAARAAGPHVAEVRDLIVEGPGGSRLPLRIYLPENPIAGLVYFHGGGWVIGSVEDSDAHVRRIVAATDAAVISVDYRLAPEHRFPAPVEDALAAWRWALARRGELLPAGAPLGIAGESAGGNIAAGAAIALRDAGMIMPAFQILGYPVTSARMDSGSFRDEGERPVLSAADMGWFWDQYAPEPSTRTDPRAAPLEAPDLSGLPSALILTAECDPLRDEGEAYAARLIQAGVSAECRRFAGMVHGFYKMADVLAGGRQALAATGAFIRSQASRDA